MSDQAPQILVIEDDAAVRYILSRILAQMGVRCTLADDGLVGLTELRQRTFDVVITDLMMPGCSGLEIAQWVASHAAGTPVLVISGYATDDDEARLAEVGAELLCKPFGSSDIRDAVTRLLVLD